MSSCSGATTAIPAGSPWFCELRPYVQGSCYHVESRARVLGWRVEKGKTLPVTAHGLVSFRAFFPNPRDPASGMAWIELRGPGSEKRWWNPLFGDVEVSDRKLKELMCELAKSLAQR